MSRELTKPSACKEAALELANLQIPLASDDHSSETHFYPRDMVLGFLTPERVKEILLCKCPECSRHLILLEQAKGSIELHKFWERITPVGRKGNRYVDRSSGAVSMFALMIFLRYPLFIITLLERDLRDTDWLDKFNKESNRVGGTEIINIQKYFDCLDDSEAKTLATSVWQNVFKFASPIFTDKMFTRFHANTVLPFLQTRHLGRGSFGEVFSFEIHPYYNQLPHPFNTLRTFARKEIKVRSLCQTGEAKEVDTHVFDFHKEVKFLHMVDDLGNPNIVRLVMSLRIGDKMNIVFPCAMTNLDCCLREEKYHLDQICHHPIRYGVIWEQMTGISDALHKILTTVREHPDAKEPLIGYHFDLKPANILVYENKPLCKSTSKDYTFKITDFGLSWFKNAESGSNTQPFIGDPRYMPPEARSGKSRRKYDVWSLGCILLEVTAFAVKSYKGVADLDEILKTASSNDQGGYTGFFSRNGSDGRAILRPEIRIFMDHDLVSALRTDEERDVSFVGKMVDLIKQMLEPNPDNRIGSEAVVEKLRSLRNEMAQDANKIVQPAAKRKDEKEIGEVELRSLERMYIKSNVEVTKERLPAMVQVFEDKYHSLRFVATPKNMPQKIYKGERLREELLLIPQYAMDKEYETGRSDTIKLVCVSEVKKAALEFDFAGDLIGLRTLQSALIGHRVHYSTVLKSVELTTPNSLYSKVKPLFGSFKTLLRPLTIGHEEPPLRGVMAEGEKGRVTIQMWRQEVGDGEYLSRNLTALVTYGTQDSNYLMPKGQPCHFVIYYNAAITIIPFHKALRLTHLEESQRQDPKLRKLEITAMDPGKHREFDMVTLESKDEPKIPGTASFSAALPLCEKKFSTMMKAKEITHQFESFGLTFDTHDDLIDFRRTYLTLRRDWLGETGKT